MSNLIWYWIGMIEQFKQSYGCLHNKCTIPEKSVFVPHSKKNGLCLFFFYQTVHGWFVLLQIGKEIIAHFSFANFLQNTWFYQYFFFYEIDTYVMFEIKPGLLGILNIHCYR